MQVYQLLLVNVNLATMNADFGYGKDVPYGAIDKGAIAIKDGKIAWLGSVSDLPKCTAKQTLDLGGKWLTPALIDCHTHLVYAGNRSNEFEMRLNGVNYSTIAKNGGGILSTVKATRAATFDELYRQSVPRLKALMEQGVASIDIKSGYGLDLDSERKMLKVAQKLGEDFGITIQKTYLAAHALPPEFVGQQSAYVDKVCQWLGILHAEGLVDAVDAFCESIAFNTQEVGKIFATAKALGLPVKLHAEQLSDMNGAGLVADFAGLSADHIEYLSENNVKKMAEKGVVGVLLPTAFYTLKETKVPPIDLMRQYGVKMAISTDCNPGTSPSTSLLLAMNMACTLFGLTPEEALAGTTVNAACALGLSKKGQLAVGLDADIAIWDIDRPADLCYLIGQNRLQNLLIGGVGRFS